MEKSGSEDRRKTRPGHIFQINLSTDGVPKRAARSAEVTILGLVGDSQRHLDIHGGPDRALCLYSLERLLSLQSAGHPIFPGSIGENLTLAEMDWGQIAPGKNLRLGTDVVLQITKYTHPCNTIAESFINGNYEQVSETRHPGWSRVYARVLQTGTIHVGDPVTIEPL
jgi:MOSC domain-containing protein YiiM